jgi:hypothetical protein
LPVGDFSEGCSDDFDDYKDRAVEYIAHLGECYRQRTNDDSCTYQNNGVKKEVGITCPCTLQKYKMIFKDHQRYQAEHCCLQQ